MKISEFAKLNNVTTKMLRHYDEIGLLKPSVVDSTTGYRSYDIIQSHYLNWIIILKNLDFPLAKIKELLDGPVSSEKLVNELIVKRIEISSAMNEQIQKNMQISKLIEILKKEGFHMDKQVNLLDITPESINEIKKNMPTMELFLETVNSIISLCTENDILSVLRFDISHFKEVNDNYGFDVGDKVIVACYNIIKGSIDKLPGNAAIGRAHGDEFVVFAKVDKQGAEKIAQYIIDSMKKFDFSSIGYMKQMGCYIGGMVGEKKNVDDIRRMIECTIETINEVRKNGSNSFVIEEYHL